jgi:hypothetical protein
MGNNFATELAELDLGLSLEDSIAIHLTSNHYPPVPRSMVKPCIDAIDAYYDEDYDQPIKLPDGVTWRDEEYAPAHAIVEAHHLQAWLPHGIDCECYDCVGE